MALPTKLERFELEGIAFSYNHSRGIGRACSESRFREPVSGKVLQADCERAAGQGLSALLDT